MRWATSGRLTPAAATLTRICPRPGFRTGTALGFNTSGPPGVLISVAGLVFGTPAMASLSVSAGLVLLTLAAAYMQRRKDDGLRSPPEARWVEAAPVETGRCAISHARFGSRRAQLVKVMQGEVPNFIVLEFGRRDPLLRLQRV